MKSGPLRALTAPLVRAFVRHVPPRRRGARAIDLYERLVEPRQGALFASRERSGMRLVCDLTNPLERAVYYRGAADPETDGWLRGWLRPGDVVVDVGAHIGSFASAALEAVGPSGLVYAFEPNPATFGRLRDAFPNGVPSNVVLDRVAVGDRRADGVAMHEPPDTDGVRGDLASLAGGSDWQVAGTVPMRRLDDLLPAAGRIRLLKLDVEGFEPAVLRGAEGLLREQRFDAVMAEINPSALLRAGSRPADVIAALEQAGYVPADPDAVAPFTAADGGVQALFTDVVFVPERVPAERSLTVVVPSSRGRMPVERHLPAVLGAVASTDAVWDAVVVDDASPDGDGAVAGALPAGAQLIRSGRRVGAAGARNLGVRRSSGAWLLLIDDDVELDSTSFAALWQAREADTCLVPEVRTESGILQNAITRFVRFGEPRWAYRADPLLEVDYPLGACLLLSRDLFERAGGFDERFQPNYFEDIAFGDRLRAAGARIVQLEGAVARHYETAATDPARARARMRAVTRNRWRYVIHYTDGAPRLLALGLAPARVAHEALQWRSLQPVKGLVDAVASELGGGRRTP